MASNSPESADFLVEIGTEELPPGSLRTLRNAFEHNLVGELHKHSIECGSPQGEFATPRRLAVLIADVALRQPDQETELLGPLLTSAFDSDGKPTPAAAGFASKAGVNVADLEQVDSPKGPRLAHKSLVPGKPSIELLAGIVRQALNAVPISRRMRWGAHRDEFVRPVHWVLMMLGEKRVPGEIFGLESAPQTRGHRFHCDQSLHVASASDYPDLLRDQGRVEPDFTVRKAMIRSAVQALAEQELNGHAVIEESLLEEVTGLVEWPVPLAGQFEERFLVVPSEALISSMKEHQKYFHVIDNEGRLLPHFITISNIESSDPQRVVDGNERVIRPRLSDAAFFYETDLKQPFANFRDQLKSIVFQEQLGTVYDKTERVSALAQTIAPIVGADAGIAKRAGQLSKCDLVSDMVLEFNSLQGIMGRYYAQHSGETGEVCEAIFEHYLPRFSGDSLPQTPAGTAVALADRIDTLSGIFGVGQVPSGSRDPFALRRQSLGVLRILVEGGYHCSLRTLVTSALKLHSGITEPGGLVTDRLIEYLLDRFSAWFADMGIAAESFLAIRALEPDNPADIYARVLAVSEFSRGESAAALASANKRVANILAKTGYPEPPAVDPNLFTQPEEHGLFTEVLQTQAAVDPSLAHSDYATALGLMANMRAPLDLFFANVMVNVEDAQIRENRHGLLFQLRSLFLSVADISVLSEVE